ncbi:MAG: hypothetical protein WDN31_00025 [Hyphomicrobium sp.]
MLVKEPVIEAAEMSSGGMPEAWFQHDAPGSSICGRRRQPGGWISAMNAEMTATEG